MPLILTYLPVITVNFCIFWIFSTLVIFTFYAFSAMFYAYSLMILTFHMANFLPESILVILSVQPNFTLVFLVSPYSFGSHTQGQDKLLVLERMTTRRLSTMRYRRIVGIYKSFDFLIFEVLQGLGLSPCHLIHPPNSKSTSGHLPITWQFP